LVQFLFLITFSIIALFNGYDVLGVVGWLIGISLLFYLNNFINILFNDKETIAIVVGCIFWGSCRISVLQYCSGAGLF
jgi:hypothetical protein